ncbi:hypothetical protein PaG_03446 [Moesziomyces aphidis]|uniref:Uncharacterized protein n=1 Tax=Moesziomyces aphidis TaxID=84754 RepID=W3VNM0_MOEAP|nr:hypothetical protein PaG_03446 [Moesziomyces aphidis]
MAAPLEIPAPLLSSTGALQREGCCLAVPGRRLIPRSRVNSEDSDEAAAVSATFKQMLREANDQARALSSKTNVQAAVALHFHDSHDDGDEPVVTAPVSRRAKVE